MFKWFNIFDVLKRKLPLDDFRTLKKKTKAKTIIQKIYGAKKLIINTQFCYFKHLLAAKVF